MGEAALTAASVEEQNRQYAPLLLVQLQSASQRCMAVFSVVFQKQAAALHVQ
jgi:hypothetical protein